MPLWPFAYFGLGIVLAWLSGIACFWHAHSPRRMDRMERLRMKQLADLGPPR